MEFNYKEKNSEILKSNCGINLFDHIPFYKVEYIEGVPEKYIINKNATILIWKDGSKTVVKRSVNDNYDKKLGFLIAFFQKYSGFSKNQANKYLDNLKDDEDLLDLNKNSEILCVKNAVANFCDVMGDNFKTVAKNLKQE